MIKKEAPSLELTRQQKERLKAIVHDDLSVSIEEVLGSVESPTELWCLSLLHVWDFPSDFLLFLAHPQCSVGQALAMYWSLNPGWLHRKSQLGHPLSESQRQELAILEKIEASVQDKILREPGILFDPHQWIESRRLKYVEYVPGCMLQRASGNQVPHNLEWVNDL